MTFYKETEFQETSIGRIPKDWEVVKLKDTSLLITDGSHFSPKHQKSGYPLATVANMRENYIDIDSCYRISREDYERLATSRDKPEIDDVLFSKDGTVGLCIVFNQKVDLIVLSSIAIIRPDMKKTDPYFLKYMLQSRSVLNRVAGSKTGTAIRRIVLRDLSTVRLSLPKRIDEQEAIVGVLGVVDSAVELVDRVIWKTERLKKGLMQTLLTRGIGHREYKQTPIGTTPKTWQIDTLNNLIDRGVVTYHMDGNHGELYPREEEFVDEGVPFLSANMITNGSIDFSKAKYVTEERAKQFRKGIAKDGDVLFAHNATVGPTAILKTGLPYVVLGTTLTAYRCNPTCLNNYYLKYFIESPLFQKQLQRIMKQTTRNQVPITAQRRLHFAIPPIDEQQKIAASLSTVDNKLALKRKEKAKLERIKQGLMDLLLTGKIRVKVD